MPPSIAIGYSIAIAQRYVAERHAQVMNRGSEISTFWDRLTSRMSEKYPDSFPTSASVTQKAAGRLIGKSQNAGFKWKHGELPERANLIAIALRLGVAVEWLETGRGPKFVPDPQDPVSAEIFRLVADSDELQRMEFLNFLQYTVGNVMRKDGKKATQLPQRARRP
jgi:hypothetical protein